MISSAVPVKYTHTLRNCDCPLGLGDAPPFLNIGPPGGGEGVNAMPGGDAPALTLLISDFPPPEIDSLRSSPESSRREAALRVLLLPEASTKLGFGFRISGKDSTLLSLAPFMAYGLSMSKKHQSPRKLRVTRCSKPLGSRHSNEVM